MGWLTRQGFGLLLALLDASSAEAAPKETEPLARASDLQPVLAVRGGAEWGVLWAPIAVAGHYLSPDGSAHVSFYEPGTQRELIAGRLEVGAAGRLPRRMGLFGRVGMVLGSSPVETQSRTVAGVRLEYPSQQMFFAFTGGAEVQLIERMLGLGFDFGWAGSWDPTRPTNAGELELIRHSSSGPYVRLSAMGRLPSKGLFGVGIFVAIDSYLTRDPSSLGANSRASVGAFFELDASR
jgi:hypothetical protein